MKIILSILLAILVLLAAFGFFPFNPATDTSEENIEWPCEYPLYKHLIGQPSSKAFETELPANTRHYPADKVPTRTDVTRLTIMHSGTVRDAMTNSESVIVGLICG